MSEAVSSGAPAGSSSEDRTLAFVAYALLFAAPFVLWIPALAAVVLAYVRRPTADPLVRTHFGFQIRIFWVIIVCIVIGLGGMILGFSVLLSDVINSATNQGQGWDAWQVAAFDDDNLRLHPVIFVGFVVAGLAWLVACVWCLIASLIGMARLSSPAPMGRIRA